MPTSQNNRSIEPIPRPIIFYFSDNPLESNLRLPME